MKIMCLVMAGLTMTILMLFKFLLEKTNNKKMNMNPFECGFDMKYNKKSVFSTKYLMMLILFLVFDVEVSFILPILLMKMNTLKSKLIILSFIIILTTLMMKEWKQGMMEWVF